jgi:Outer membrane protein beta-barrel domain
VRKIVLSALVAGAALSAGSLAAQSNTSGFMLNGHFAGSSVSGTVEDSEPESGGGFGVALGYGFNERVTLYANLDVAELEYEEGDEEDGDDGKFGAGTVDLGLRINFGHDGQRWRPYLNTAFTAVVLADEMEEFEAATAGGGITLGGGVQYFFSPSLAFDGALNVTAGSFTTVEIDGEEEDLDAGIGFSHGRLQLGVTWHP